MSSKIEITLKKSTICKSDRQKKIIASLGLRKINQTRLYPDNNCIRGMVNKVSHLVSYKLV